MRFVSDWFTFLFFLFGAFFFYLAGGFIIKKLSNHFKKENPNLIKAQYYGDLFFQTFIILVVIGCLVFAIFDFS